ncbi:transformer-2 sex-determining protein [Stomoxys calcitrans]|uniref:Putative transformer-2 protein n=1 Tax=Stomoxys calcitrans TaxID=35570 RepID=D9I2X4_STOCA|nr:transformer-2 sex-determining protein [Stomoxys calcitrans]ADI86271.1 putative transformer-2 protein [Stomoxys calcitrans]
MGPRSRSRSPAARGSYSRSPDNRRGYHRSQYREKYISKHRHPPSPPPLPPGKRHGSRGRSFEHRRSRSRSDSGRYDRRNYSSRPRSRTRSRSPHARNDRNNREKPIPCRCLGVFGLSVNTTQPQIREIFGKFGPIESIQVVMDAQTRRSRGFCFIYYKYLADAEAARDNCCGLEVDGRRIRVAYSITERPHTPTPGAYRGRPTKGAVKRHRDRKSPSPYNHRRRSRSRSYTPRRHRY